MSAASAVTRQQTVPEQLLCQKYNRRAAAAPVYSTAKQTHADLINKSVNNKPFFPSRHEQLQSYFRLDTLQIVFQSTSNEGEELEVPASRHRKAPTHPTVEPSSSICGSRFNDAPVCTSWPMSTAFRSTGKLNR